MSYGELRAGCRPCDILAATDSFPVRQLPFADNIIVLSAPGRIAQTGTFADLRAQNGYVSSLALETRPSRGDDDAREADTDTDTADPVPVKAAAEDESDDLARQTGDRSLYKFYLKSTGLPLSLGFLLLAIGYVSLGRMPTIWYVRTSYCFAELPGELHASGASLRTISNVNATMTDHASRVGYASGPSMARIRIVARTSAATFPSPYQPSFSLAS